MQSPELLEQREKPSPVCEPTGAMYRRELNPVISSSPVKIIIACYVHQAYCKPVWELEIFSNALGQLDDPPRVPC